MKVKRIQEKIEAMLLDGNCRVFIHEWEIPIRCKNKDEKEAADIALLAIPGMKGDTWALVVSVKDALSWVHSLTNPEQDLFMDIHPWGN